MMQIFNRHGTEITGRVIGQETRGVPRGAGQRDHIVSRLRELDVSQSELADVTMNAARQAWGEAGTIRLPNGDIAVVPGQPKVKDTFVIKPDGTIDLRKSIRHWDDETKQMTIEWLD